MSVAQQHSLFRNGDPFWDFVVSQKDWSSLLTDQALTPPTWSVAGTPNPSITAISPTVPWGTNYYSSGTGPAYIQSAFTGTDPLCVYSASAWTVEWWMYAPSVLGGTWDWMDCGFTGATRGWRISVYPGAGSVRNVMQIQGGVSGNVSITVDVAGSQAFPVATWTFFAASYSGGTVQTYMGGNRITSAALGVGSAGAGTFKMGVLPASPVFRVGPYRITKGVARYTGTTCPVPATPFGTL